MMDVARDRTKTKSSCRTLPLIPACEQMLKKMKKEQELNRKVCGKDYCTDYLDYIYVNPMGKRVHPDYLTQHFPIFLTAHDMKRIFIPFTTQELYQSGKESLYYGLNALSNNLIMVDRKKLKNPNGLILGTPGSGKSFSAKREIANAFLVTDDDIIINDPEGEVRHEVA